MTDQPDPIKDCKAQLRSLNPENPARLMERAANIIEAQSRELDAALEAVTAAHLRKYETDKAAMESEALAERDARIKELEFMLAETMPKDTDARLQQVPAGMRLEFEMMEERGADLETTIIELEAEHNAALVRIKELEQYVTDTLSSDPFAHCKELEALAINLRAELSAALLAVDGLRGSLNYIRSYLESALDSEQQGFPLKVEQLLPDVVKFIATPLPITERVRAMQAVCKKADQLFTGDMCFDLMPSERELFDAVLDWRELEGKKIGTFTAKLNEPKRWEFPGFDDELEGK